MNTTSIAFLICLISGLATLIGTIFIFFKIKNKENIIIKALSFAAGVMITVSFIDLLPEGLHLLKNNLSKNMSYLLILVSACFGTIIAFIIDKLTPNNEKNIDGSLYKVGIISMIAIILHNIPEGIATYITTSTNLKLGISLAISIALHNIPEGISISIPIYIATNNKLKAFFYTFISGMSEFLGAVLTHFFLLKYINNFNLGILLGLIAGIMLYIGAFELLNTSLKYQKISKTVIWFTFGVILMIVKSFF